VTVLRERLLAGRAVALRGSVPPAVRDALVALAASVDGDAPGVLIYDAEAAFAAGGRDGLRAAVDGAWSAILEVAVRWAAPEAGEGGKVVLIAPGPGAGPFAVAAAAALENLVRTLSVEWARYALTATVIVPGAAAIEEQIGELVCFLASPAGDYFSGSRFELG
jgi:NAD(P)-dependent dehydrogenase (short-subunit alcohol dehydrogenase family)